MTVPATVVPVKISKGQDKWGECAKVEESGEDGQDQEKNLLALAWTTGSRQSWKQTCFFFVAILQHFTADISYRRCL